MLDPVYTVLPIYSPDSRRTLRRYSAASLNSNRSDRFVLERPALFSLSEGSGEESRACLPGLTLGFRKQSRSRVGVVDHERVALRVVAHREPGHARDTGF